MLQQPQPPPRAAKTSVTMTMMVGMMPPPEELSHCSGERERERGQPLIANENWNLSTVHSVSHGKPHIAVKFASENFVGASSIFPPILR